MSHEPAAHLRTSERSGELVEKKIAFLLTELTLEEKIGFVHANSKFTIAPVPRLGIPEFTMSDGPHGVRREIARDSWAFLEGCDDLCTYLPTGTAQAATWNRNCAKQAGSVLGAEARARGKDVILGPGFNIIRYPLCGRNFEYYTEDPFLAAEIAVPAVQAIQAEDTAACIKHFACNSQELNRMRVDARLDERALREIYLPAFEAATQVGASLTVMGAYNQVRGQQACHQKYLVCDVLKREWGFSGAFISDWAGATSTHESVRFGLDIEMGTNTDFEDYYLAKPYRQAILEGTYGTLELNDKVSRVLRVMFAVGIFDSQRKVGARNTRAHQQAAYDVAAEAVVLLKNEGQLLPFKKSIKTLAVLGDNADRLHAEGGNSSGVRPVYEVSPLAGLKNRLGASVEIVHLRGYPDTGFAFESIPGAALVSADPGSGVKGWKKFGYANARLEGTPVQEIFVEEVRVQGDQEVPSTGENPKSLLFAAEIMVPEAGEYSFAASGAGVLRFLINEELNFESERGFEERVVEVKVQLSPGVPYRLRLECLNGAEGERVRFGWRTPGDSGRLESQGLEAAVALAKRADAVVIFGGLNHFHDTEGKDRNAYGLPGGQDELIERVLACNQNTAVVLIAGSPVAMPWLAQAPSVVWGWYGGMEIGNVLADVLFGDINPSGKLPFSIPKRLADNSVIALDDYHSEASDYPEGVLVGYRWHDAKGIEPLFPFGHGETYTTFELTQLELQNSGAQTLAVSVTLTNTGTRPGAEVVQLYVEDVEASVIRPPRELKGFEKVLLAAGQSQRLSFQLPKRAFAFWDDSVPGWVVEPGEFRIHVGTSSRRLPLVASVVW